MRNLVVILGIPIDNLDMEEALDCIDEFIRVGRATGKSHQIATVNTDFVVKSLQDPELRYLLQEADLTTADGMPLVWGARLLGVPLKERVAGADMVPALAARAAEKGYSMYFLGAAPGVAARAAEILQNRHPGLKIAGVHSPPKSSVLEMPLSIIEDIKTANPDILLVAFGNPKQEKWIGMYARELNVPVMIGVGGTFDFIAGMTKRAPLWMQRIGLEWLHRLLQEPRRLWRRYVVDVFAFSSFYIRQWWFMRTGGRVPAPLLPATDVLILDGVAIMNVKGRVDMSNSQTLMEKGQAALEKSPYLIINLADNTFIDSSGIGALIGLAKQARNLGGDVRLAAVPDFTRKILAWMRLDRFFEIVDSVKAGWPSANAGPSTPQTHRRGVWTVYRMPRRMDATTTPDILASCAALLEENPFLILDFSDTVFLSSAGLAGLSRLNRQAGSLKGALRLCCCAEDITKVIKLAGFDKVLSIYPDADAATQ